MYQDIETQLNKIIGSLKKQLKEVNAIDENGNATDIEKFNQILDKKIAQCNALLATTEKDGVTVDRYGANIAFSRLERLHSMKKFGTLNPEPGIEETPTEQKEHKQSEYKTGMAKIFAKLQSKFRQKNSKESNR